MNDEDDKKIIVVNFPKKHKEKSEKEKGDAIIYGNIIKRVDHLIPANQEPEDEPA